MKSSDLNKWISSANHLDRRVSGLPTGLTNRRLSGSSSTKWLKNRLFIIKKLLATLDIHECETMDNNFGINFLLYDPSPVANLVLWTREHSFCESLVSIRDRWGVQVVNHHQLWYHHYTFIAPSWWTPNPSSKIITLNGSFSGNYHSPVYLILFSFPYALLNANQMIDRSCTGSHSRLFRYVIILSTCAWTWT